MSQSLTLPSSPLKASGVQSYSVPLSLAITGIGWISSLAPTAHQTWLLLQAESTPLRDSFVAGHPVLAATLSEAFSRGERGAQAVQLALNDEAQPARDALLLSLAQQAIHQALTGCRLQRAEGSESAPPRSCVLLWLSPPELTLHRLLLLKLLEKSIDSTHASMEWTEHRAFSDTLEGLQQALLYAQERVDASPHTLILVGGVGLSTRGFQWHEPEHRVLLQQGYRPAEGALFLRLESAAQASPQPAHRLTGLHWIREPQTGKTALLMPQFERITAQLLRLKALEPDERRHRVLLHTSEPDGIRLKAHVMSLEHPRVEALPRRLWADACDYPPSQTSLALACALAGPRGEPARTPLQVLGHLSPALDALVLLVCDGLSREELDLSDDGIAHPWPPGLLSLSQPPAYDAAQWAQTPWC